MCIRQSSLNYINNLADDAAEIQDFNPWKYIYLSIKFDDILRIYADAPDTLFGKSTLKTSSKTISQKSGISHANCQPSPNIPHTTNDTNG